MKLFEGISMSTYGLCLETVSFMYAARHYEYSHERDREREAILQHIR